MSHCRSTGALPRCLYSKVPSWAAWVCEIGRTLFFLRTRSCWGRCVIVSGSPVAGRLPGASKECSLSLAKHVTQSLELVKPVCWRIQPIPSLLVYIISELDPGLSYSPASATGWSMRLGLLVLSFFCPNSMLFALGPGGHCLKPLPSHRIDLTYILPFRGRLRDMRGNGECITSLRESYGCGVLDSFMLTLI